jgi:tetratricopeptide (TPR) repeat protein
MFEPGRLLLRLTLPLVGILAFSISSAGARAQQNPAPAALQVSNGPGAAFKFTKEDLKLLAEANAIDSDLEQRGFVLHDPVVQAYLDSTGNRILAGRPVPEKVAFRFFALRDTSVNAYSYANGSIYVTTGMLALLKNEAQLASVLSHETSHVYDRHSYLENRSIGQKSLTIEIIAAAAHWVPGGYAGWLAATAASSVSSLILIESIYGYSREKEQQADSDGIAALASIGYDPHAMAAAFDLCDQDSTLEYEPRPTFYHDHPRLKEREAAALAYADHHAPANPRTVSEQDYLNAVAPAIVSNVEDDLESRKPRTAVARATRLVNAFPGNPEYQMLLGEAYRQLGAKTTEPTQAELTLPGEADQRKLMLNMSEEQEQKKLLLTDQGRATLKQNEAAAEKLFLAVVQEQPDDAVAYRELGFLYEDEGRPIDAAANYQEYLKRLAPNSLDRYRIERRLAKCQASQTAETH